VTSVSPSTTSIDVSAIVSQLMTIANKPLDSVNSQIETRKLAISDLGTLKSKLATFQTSLDAFEDPNTFNTVSASSNNVSALSVSASSGAAMGRYSLRVNQTAESSNISVAGFSTAMDSLSLNVSTGFTLTIGSQSYYSNHTYTSNSSVNNSVTYPATTGGTVSAISTGPTLTELKTWINSVATNFDVGVNASIVQTGTSAFALVLSGISTGIDNAIQFSGLNGSSVSATKGASSVTSSANASSSGYSITINTEARDALLTVNGLQVQRSSNSISDVVAGVTFNLLKPVIYNTSNDQDALVTVGAGTDNSQSAITNLITSYNNVITQYKSMTKNSTTSIDGSVGSFGSDTGLLSFVNNFKLFMAKGMLTSSNATTSLAHVGIDYNIDGTLKFNSYNYGVAQSEGLLATLSSGVSIGAEVGGAGSLSSSLAEIVDAAGTVDDLVNIETTNILTLTKKQTTLQYRLDQIQRSYISQYSNLNTLLYNLSQTSAQLTNSLTAVTNINSGK